MKNTFNAPSATTETVSKIKSPFTWQFIIVYFRDIEHHEDHFMHLQLHLYLVVECPMIQRNGWNPFKIVHIQTLRRILKARGIIKLTLLLHLIPRKLSICILPINTQKKPTPLTVGCLGLKGLREKILTRENPVHYTFKLIRFSGDT